MEVSSRLWAFWGSHDDVIKLLRGKIISNIFSFRGHTPLTARVAVIQPGPNLNLTKLKLEFLKSDLSAKTKKDKSTEENLLLHSSLTFFKFSSSLRLEYRHKSLLALYF